MCSVCGNGTNFDWLRKSCDISTCDLSPDGNPEKYRRPMKSAIPLSAMGLSAVCDCNTHYFWVAFMRTAMALATFAWSSLSLRHSLKFSCGDSNGD